MDPISTVSLAIAFVVAVVAGHTEYENYNLRKEKDELEKDKEGYIKDSSTLLSDLTEEQAKKKLADVVDTYHKSELQFGEKKSTLLEFFNDKKRDLDRKLELKYNMLGDNLSDDLNKRAKDDITILKGKLNELSDQARKDLLESIDEFLGCFDSLSCELGVLINNSPVSEKAIRKHFELIREFKASYTDLLKEPVFKGVLVDENSSDEKLREKLNAVLMKLEALDSDFEEKVKELDRIAEEKEAEEAKQKNLEEKREDRQKAEQEKAKKKLKNKKQSDSEENKELAEKKNTEKEQSDSKANKKPAEEEEKSENKVDSETSKNGAPNETGETQKELDSNPDQTNQLPVSVLEEG